MNEIQQQIVENLMFPIAVVTAEGELPYSNASFRASFGDGAGNWVRAGCKTLGGERGWLIPFFDEDQEMDEVEVEYESRQYRVRRVPTGEANSRVALSFHDVTKEKEIEQARSDFTSMIVHDLRGPLSGIQGTLEFILDNPDTHLEALHSELLEESMRESKRMMNLIDEILDFSKIQSGNFEFLKDTVHIGSVLQHSVKSLAQASQRDGVHLMAAHGHDLPPIEGSSEKLTQVLINLLSNSLKFTPKGGIVTVAAKPLRAEDGSQNIVITVTDTGIGIKPEEQTKLFQKYQQASGKSFRGGGGTGLGLFIVKEVTEAHGGTVSLASVEGVGTSMVITIPVPVRGSQRSA